VAKDAVHATVDPGLIKAFDASGRSNLGHALETAVQNELARRKAEAGYVKSGDGLEVPETSDRELRALTAAATAHPRAVRQLFVLDRGQALRDKAPGVEVEPAYEWLLATPTGP